MMHTTERFALARANSTAAVWTFILGKLSKSLGDNFSITCHSVNGVSLSWSQDQPGERTRDRFTTTVDRCPCLVI